MGQIKWNKTYGSSGQDNPYFVSSCSDGGFILNGHSGGNDLNITGCHGTSYVDYWIVKLDSLGSLNWQKCLGGSGIDIGYCVKETTDGGYLVLGASTSNDGDATNNSGNTDAWAVKLNPYVGINSLSKSIFAIVSPNPNSNFFRLYIEKTLVNGEVVIYSILGQNVFSQKIEAGENRIETKNLANGVYNYEVLENKNQILKGKLVIGE